MGKEIKWGKREKGKGKGKRESYEGKGNKGGELKKKGEGLIFFQ